MNIIKMLKAAPAQQRAEILQDLYQKNLNYFAGKHPAIHQGLCLSHASYQIDINEIFLDIIDSRTKESCFQGVGAETMAEALGAWTHQAWSDLVDLRLRTLPAEHEHSRIVRQFSQGLLSAFPQFGDRFKQLQIDLPAIGEGRKFSNATVFIGLFHGLHISHYLQNTEIRTAAFIEPDPERFMVSCYFLDYEELDKRFDGLLIHVGPHLDGRFFRYFLAKAYVSGHVWVRALCGYASDANRLFLQQLNNQWQALGDIWVPADLYLSSMDWGMANLTGQYKYLAAKPSLSARSRIAIIGAGPSLSSDLEWLRSNREKLLIFATHSAIRPLRDAGIDPDVQFSLDLHLNDSALKRHALDPDVPLIVDCRSKPEFLQHFNRVLLIAGESISYPVKFFNLLKEIAPTTGNLCTSFAGYCEPAELYLLGMDLGFKDRSCSHASGSLYDDIEGLHEQVAGDSPLVVEANFTETGSVLTRPYYNEARLRLEELIGSLPETVSVVNLTDGAKIKGTVAQRSEDLVLSGYAERLSDLEIILSSFRPPRQGRDWQLYRRTGHEVLDFLRSETLSSFSPEKFNWPEFSRQVDSLLLRLAVEIEKHEAGDCRAQAYLNILKDIFVAWYRFLCFSVNKEESQYLYGVGKDLLGQAMEEFVWPAEKKRLNAK